MGALFAICKQYSTRLHGYGSKWTRASTARIGIAFAGELVEPFQTEPLAVPERVHLESRSRMDQTKKFSCKPSEPFSSGTLRNETRANSTNDN